MSESPSTAEEFVADLEAAKKEIEKLQQSNIAKVQALGNFGKGVDLAYLANLKIDTFIDAFLDEKAKLVYVRNLETRLKVDLDGILAELRQAQLTEGIATAKQKLIVPRK